MSKKEPLVSVLVPCYNHEKYIKECVESIVFQTYSNIELIVIDDGSSDSSPKLLQELAERYDFHLIIRKNKGLSESLNEGINLSGGKYICICASDDKYFLDKIQKQVDFMEKNPRYGVCYTKAVRFYDNGRERALNNKNYKQGNIFSELLSQYFTIPAGSSMFRKEVFSIVGLYDTSLLVEDYDMFLRIAKVYEIGFLNEFLFYYRLHKTNTGINIEGLRMMEANAYKVLDKWKNESQYAKAIIRTKLLYFRSMASAHKFEAIKRIPLNPTIVWDIFFIEGLLRLLIPKFLYRRIRGR